MYIKDIMIDEAGVKWAEGDTWLRMRYNMTAEDEDFDFPMYIVRNFRFARLQYVANRMRISFRLHTLTEETASEVVAAMLGLDRIFGSGPLVPRFMLNPITPGVDPEIITNGEDAVERFIQIATAPGVYERPRYNVQSLSLQRLHAARLAPLRHALARWCEAGGVLGSQETWQDSQRLALLACIEPNAVVIKGLNGSYSGVDKAWLDTAPGLPLSAHPDARYGLALTESYRAAAKTGWPTLEWVNAEIDSPGGAMRSSYVRLLLPWSPSRKKPGAALVSSCSVVRTNLPVLRPL